MRFMILITVPTDDRDGGSAPDGEELRAAHRALIDELVANGELVDTNELAVEDATVVGQFRGAPAAGAGPFTEGGSSVGGFYIVDVEGRERAVEIACRLPEGRVSPVEVRRLVHEPAAA